ncbi:cupin domain-containing protein [Streptomyces sp. NPDC006798]|uniref:JmjC domain-containing protein n=1 Tax=Streptomyces sp. NPDC006798 TaxID=3155462 RepID=UPI0033C62E47
MTVARGFAPLTTDGAGIEAAWGDRAGPVPVAAAFLAELDTVTVGRLLAEPSLRPPRISFARDGRQIPDREVTAGSGPPGPPGGAPLDREKAAALVAAGATVMVYGAQRVVPSLGRITGHIAASLRASCDTTVFHTPAGNPGLGWHRDGQHVVAVQIGGSKEWRVERRAPEYWWTTGALRSDGPDTEVDRITLRPGEALYMPPGVAHTARATDESSTHVSFVVQEPATRELALALFERASRSVGTRLDRGPVAGRKERAAAVARELASAVAALDVNELLGLVEADAMESGG